MAIEGFYDASDTFEAAVQEERDALRKWLADYRATWVFLPGNPDSGPRVLRDLEAFIDARDQE